MPRALRLPAALLAAALCALAGPARAEKEPSDIVQERYAAAARDFARRAEAFSRKAPGLPAGRAGTAALRREVEDLRMAYKRIEFLVDYAHPGAAKRLNPPPFARAEVIAPDMTQILEPEGLQLLLELAHGDDPLRTDRERVARLALRVADAARELADGIARPELDDRMLFEAMQNQVIRVMTQGIAGFDAPATERALPESRASLAALRPVIALYLPELRKRDPALARRLPGALDRAERMLGKSGFDAFDRLAFLREAGNPLYAALVDAQHALGVPTADDLGPMYRRPVSTTARNMFDPGFLDPHFYARTVGERMDPRVAALGRRLFFDPVLSGGALSCAACHDPRRAFSDGLPRSRAPGGGHLPRNAPGLSHAAYQAAQFWDLRASTLELQIDQVVHGRQEFGTDFLAARERLEAHPEYPGLFREAFGIPESEGGPVTVGAMTKAIAMYIRSLPRWDSPFDRYARGETDTLDPAAKRGFNLFMGKAACATCHFPPAFNGTLPPRYLETEAEVLGVPARFPAARPEHDDDLGRADVHYNEVFLRAFKTPTVRNAELTAPYMHNGGMETLEDVMEFYNAGGGAGLGLDVPNQTLPPDSLGLTRRDMDDLVAFIRSLTDTTGYGEEGKAVQQYNSTAVQQ